LDEAVLAGFGHIHFGGVYLQHSFRHRIAGLLAAAEKLGITSSLDPQWDGTERWEYMDEWLPRLTWFFLNEDEARSLTRAGTAEEALLVLASRTRCPLVKTGERGVLAHVKGEALRIPARVVQVVDTTGAGDSFDAGFLYATREKGMDVAEAAAFGNAVAARSCTFVGGVNARSSYADVARFIETNPGLRA
jgi:sugar/nucleoside kinase (ribokinase family)